jgi:hypothetical protein
LKSQAWDLKGSNCSATRYTSLRNERTSPPSWPGFGPAIHVLATRKDVDARDKRGHDESRLRNLVLMPDSGKVTTAMTIGGAN